MPELPEVENVRRGLEALVGQRVVGVDVRRGDFVEGPGDAVGRMLVGQKLTAVQRLGKQLALVGEPTVVGAHLGMTGSLRVYPDGRFPVDRHTHVVWRFESGAVLAARDPRRFGGLWLHDHWESLWRERWSRLGPDALEVTPGALEGAIGGSRRPIKATLLDQSVVAGLGNIYVDELLFETKLHPGIRDFNYLKITCFLLVKHLRPLLERAIRAGGSTLRDYSDASGKAGGFQLEHRVYGRGGEPCFACGGKLRVDTIAGRTTVFCPACQPRSQRRKA